MAKSTADEHYEEEFEFPLWKLIRERAEEKDISYAQAAFEVFPEFEKGIRFRDKEYEQSEIRKWQKELDKLRKREISKEKRRD